MLNMKYRIEKQTTIKAVFEFTPDKYVLCKDLSFPEGIEGYSIEYYSLNHKIDMSYCGKPDQCGISVLVLSESEFDELKENGFEIFDLTY